jgi:hypothetical protein
MPPGCQKRRGDGTLSRYDNAIGILDMVGTASIAMVRELVPYLDVRKRRMSLPSQPLDTIPPETARVARAAFPHSTRFMQMRDVLGTIYDHPAFAAL